MLLLETIELAGGIWLAVSALAFILLAGFATTRQESATPQWWTAAIDRLEPVHRTILGRLLPPVVRSAGSALADTSPIAGEDSVPLDKAA